MPIRVEVTQHDIDHGQRCDPHNCPVARAITRTAGFPTFVSSMTYRIQSDPKNYNQVHNLPESARLFVKEFDQDRHSVRPTIFTLTD